MDPKLKNEIIDCILKSGLSFGTVMKTLKEVNFHFESKAETFLTDADIGKVSESEGTAYFTFLH